MHFWPRMLKKKVSEEKAVRGLWQKQDLKDPKMRRIFAQAKQFENRKPRGLKRLFEYFMFIPMT